MPKPDHFICTWSGVVGTVAAPLEEWSFSLRCDGSTESLFNGSDLQVTADALWTAYAVNLGPTMRSDVILTKTRIARYTAGNNTVSGLTGAIQADTEGGYLQADNVVAHPGEGAASATNRMPLQTALCVSLNTARPGARGKGRVFLPWPRWGIGADYRLSSTDAGLLADGAKAFLDAINDIGLPGTSNLQVCVASSFGHLTTVESIRIGKAPDTMRSRRTNLLEEYLTRSISFA